MTHPVYSLGFRPFFLSAVLWAALAMALWIGALAGLPVLPGWVDPLSWHAHEMVFGYLGAALAGFLLTAAPSWTKQPPVTGTALAGLFALWIAGRVALLLGGPVPWGIVAAVDLALPVVLFLVTGRMVLAARNWRNLSVLGALALLIVGNGVFHAEAVRGGGIGGLGLRLGLAAGLLMIAVVGGRIVPAFTRNWLKRDGKGPLPPDGDRVDILRNGTCLLALGLWCMAPNATVTAVALMGMSCVLIWRLSHWGGGRTLSEPLVWVLHLAYAFLPLGGVAMALSVFGILPYSAALHLWTVGAVGLMTIAVMTRATLGHSGGVLSAGPGTAVIYASITAAALLRPLADLSGGVLMLQSLAALCWIAGFAGFVLLYGGRHLRAVPG